MDVLQQLQKDVRFIEGLHACMNCGVCTAICPAAEYFEYDPRSIAITVQSGDKDKIKDLLESDTIWFCGQCMSCKTRCPRNNCPGLIINALRKVSQETGAFIKSKYGRQQYLLVKSIGENILNFGYCIHPSVVTPREFPEQGSIWQWIFENKEKVYKTVGANLDGEGKGALRKISDNDLDELESIFSATGGLELFETIELFSRQKAKELGFFNEDGSADMKQYSEYLQNDEKQFA